MAATYNFSLDQGATKRLRLIYQYQSGVDNTDPLHPVAIYSPHSLAGCTARMQIRQAVGGDVLAEFTTENGNIELEAGGNTGQVDVTMTATETMAISIRKVVYDLELAYLSGDVVRLVQGKISVSLNVTV